MSNQIRLVNVVPNSKVKIKKEIKIELEDDSVSCKVCSKGFLNEVALRNHVRMEHMDVFATGDPDQWTVYLEKHIEDMFPNIGSEIMNSEDVSYIIIKDDQGVKAIEPPQKKKKVEAKKRDEPRELLPIAGPFECLQPSGLVDEGICHQIFFSCCEYSIHYRDEHTRRRKGIKCQVCEKPLSLNGQVVPNAVPYPCEVCGAEFHTNKDLTQHVSTVHVKLKPFQCRICNKRFTQQGGLHQHMRMHTGDRPFPCTVCNKAFTQKSGLDQHMRIHTNTKPYRCVICNKSFCQSVHVKQHMRTHTNVSPFQCAICLKRFKQSSHLNYHLRYHNPATLNDEQKSKYMQLVGMVNQGIQHKEVPRAETIEIEIEEQALAEQSIIQCDGEEYVLSDNPDWSVRFVPDDTQQEEEEVEEVEEEEVEEVEEE